MRVNDFDIEKLKSDENVFSQMIQQYKGLMYYIIRSIVGDAPDADDCFSMASMRIWSAIESFDPQKSALNTWITVITRNTAINYKKKESRNPDSVEISMADGASLATPESELLDRETGQQLKFAIQQLNQRDRIMFYRKYYYLQSETQIAAEMGITVKAVESRLYRIRKKIRQRMEAENDER